MKVLKVICIILLISFTSKVYSQEGRILTHGIIKNDSIPVENDTLIFSDILSGNRKKDRTLKRLFDKNHTNNYSLSRLQKIRNYFTDEFFIKRGIISTERINPFLDYCLSKKL